MDMEEYVYCLELSRGKNLLNLKRGFREMERVKEGKRIALWLC